MYTELYLQDYKKNSICSLDANSELCILDFSNNKDDQCKYYVVKYQRSDINSNEFEGR